MAVRRHLVRADEELQLVPTEELVGEVAAEQDAAVAAARLVHTVAVVGVGVRPQQVEEQVVLERAWRLRALAPRVEPAELLHRDAAVAPQPAVDDEDLRAHRERLEVVEKM